MIINSTTLDALRVSFSTAFQGGLEQAGTAYGRIATTVPSTTKENKYGWLGKLPNVREWIGPRAVQALSEHDYAIPNKTYELTIGVDRDDIEDDNIGVYSPLMIEMGRAVAAQPDQLVYGLLKNGWATDCYDGQPFFDTDHPVLDEDGNETTAANTDGGAGTPWFLLDVSRAIKPLIFQERRAPQFVARDRPTDSNVFDNKEFRYGVDCRRNVGFGFWQFAWGSKQTLNAANYAAARAALAGMKGDYGRPLGLLAGGVKPLLVFPPVLESAAMKILNNEMASGGESNEWKGTAEPLMVSWLA